MNDVWVCDACRSINRMRDSQCYHCHGPREAAMESAGPDLRTINAAAERTVGSYVISWPLALISVVLLVAVAVLGLIVLKLQVADYPRLRQAFVDAIAAGSTDYGASLSLESVQAALLGTLRMGLVVLALFTFAGWLALVTRNVPLLGGGTPSRSPVRVFFYTVIPLWHLLKVPGMIQDALYRVDPKEGGAFMVLAAWIGLVGSVFVSFLGNWAITSKAIDAMIPAIQAKDDAALVKVFGDVLDQSFWLQVVVEIMIAFGTILLAAIMVRIESRCAARDREIRDHIAEAGTPTTPEGPNWAGAAVAATADAPRAAAPEPDWPAGRPWPGSPNASASASAGETASSSLSTPSGAPLPPPPPADSPRLG